MERMKVKLVTRTTGREGQNCKEFGSYIKRVVFRLMLRCVSVGLTDHGKYGHLERKNGGEERKPRSKLVWTFTTTSVATSFPCYAAAGHFDHLEQGDTSCFLLLSRMNGEVIHQYMDPEERVKGGRRDESYVLWLLLVLTRDRIKWRKKQGLEESG